MTNSADPDQLASSEASWSGSTLFAKAGYIRVQQDKGECNFLGLPYHSCQITEQLHLLHAEVSKTLLAGWQTV